ncbi:hydroxymethylpyrimidine/phosphomethylpyrimidine kinase [Candidatus Thioglobus sp.]|jgi:hydroxymethylpyrimidine/phosphomethylpyrimidine kinase|nr:hydroxymethylpyrimidine/phosphomethylpyrimidine kinase [Candidatus Thioglobus sp.]MDB9975978.1 hydroxymethylpyrimidine/phosphomethylpyrimidine kinase [Candidatus Thioglobus sp.]
MVRLEADSVLLFSGLDPSGAAGVSADIETINQFGVTPLPIITTLTAQNTQRVLSLEPTKNSLLELQFKLIDEDISFNTVKIGLLGTSSQVKTISKLLSNKKGLNIVLDPIISSSTDDILSSKEMIDAMKNELIPLCLIVTPNLAELNALAPGFNEESAISSLNCPWVLLTTSDSSEIQVEHRLYHNANLVSKFTYKKLTGQYHGSGCTLSSAIAALLADNVPVEDACKKALDYTYQSLLSAKKVGKMQYHPNRTFPKQL